MTDGSFQQSPPEGHMTGGQFHLPVRVYYEDTDAAGIVYYANYLKFLERARTEMLRYFGFEHQTMLRGEPVDQRSFAVRRCDIEYLKPAKLDDVIHVSSEIVTMTAAQVVLDQKISRGDSLLCRATVTAVCIDGFGRPRRLPREFRHILAGIVDSNAQAKE